MLNSPIVLGHESSGGREIPGCKSTTNEDIGTIVEIGSAVKNVRLGDRVAIEPGVPCRHCDYCRSGQYNLCADTVFAATPPWDGTLSKYYIVASDYVYRIPDHLTMEEGALVEPMAVAVQVAKVANLRANQTVVVFGCGPIGLLCQAVAKAYGAKKVIGIGVSKIRACDRIQPANKTDVTQSRLDLAKSFGADGVFLPPRPSESSHDPMAHAEKVAAEIKRQFELGEGADVVLECTGAEPCIQAGIYSAKKGGTYVQTGMGKENVIFPITTACIRALNIKGSIRYTTGCYPAAINLIATGKIDVKRLVTNRFKFEEAEEAFKLVKAGKSEVFKVIIEGVKD